MGPAEWPGSYLHGRHANLPPGQDAVLLQHGHMGRLQLHEVGHQVRDVELPVRAEQVSGLGPVPGSLGHELRQDAHGGSLELQRTAAAPPLLVLLVLAVLCGPAGSAESWGSIVPAGETEARGAVVACAAHTVVHMKPWGSQVPPWTWILHLTTRAPFSKPAPVGFQNEARVPGPRRETARAMQDTEL